MERIWVHDDSVQALRKLAFGFCKMWNNKLYDLDSQVFLLHAVKIILIICKLYIYCTDNFGENEESFSAYKLELNG